MRAPMDVHKPKPAHGWSELVSEIGIIVLGVLIALGAEQGVEALRWRHQAVEARTALRGELGDSAANAYLHRAIFKCNSEALDKLRQDLLKSGPAWKGRPVRYVATSFAWDASAWRTAQASGTLAHMAADEASGFAEVYQYLATFSELEARSQNDGAEIDLLAYDQSLADGGRGRMLAAVNRAERQNVLIAQAAKPFLEKSATLGVALTDATKQKLQARVGGPGDDCYAAPSAD